MIIFKIIAYYGILIPISLLPFPLLYCVSTVLFYFIYYVIGYRKKVVRNNLKNSFPNKSNNEILKIEKQFYKHLCDIIVETIKGFTISEYELKKRVSYSNLYVINNYFKKNKSVIVATAHYGNWEMAALSMALYFPHTTMGIYHPLKDKFFDKKITQSRGKFGLNLVASKNIGSFFKINKLVVSGFIADQTPHNVYRCHWMQFLNQETPVYLGTEKYAIQFNQPVLYGKINKVKRGFYSIHFDIITENPKSETPYFITETHTKLLEQQIQEQPAFWLWTHRRWKRKKPANFKPIQ